MEFKDFKRVEIPEIPVDALREALVNSLCHRDYFRAESNKVAIFKDRIKIYNPGEFTARYEPSDYIHGDAESVHRNPLISEILYFSKDVERWGTGIRRIYDECTENDVKVEFMKESGGFSIMFYRSDVGDLAEDAVCKVDTTQVTPQVTPQVRKMLEACIKPRSRDEIQQIMGLSDREHLRKAYLLHALEAGWITMTIPDKPRSRMQMYVITEAGKKTLESVE